MYSFYAVQRNLAKITLLPTPPSFAFSGLNCDALSMLCMDPRMMQKIRHQFYLHYSIDSAILLHIVTPRAAALTSTSFLRRTYPERSLTCFIGNTPKAAANTPREQIKVISTQTLERERSFVHTIQPSAEVGTHWGFI